MFVHVRTFTAALSGSVIKLVTCEQCNEEYAYRLIRRGQGTGSAVYGIGSGAAKLRAEQGAAKALKKRLERGIDPVPCPDCGWIQETMVRELRRRRHRWLIGVSVTLGILFGLILLIWLLTATKGFDRALNRDDKIVLTVMAGALAAGIALPIALRRFLQQLIDPNRDFPQKPARIPGAPVGFKPDGSPGQMDDRMQTDSDPDGVLSYARMPPEIEPGGWTTIQLLNPPLPMACCGCLQQTHRTEIFKPRQLVEVPMRCCAACKSRSRKILWLWIAGCTLLPAAAMYCYTLTWRKQEIEAQIGLMVLVGIFGCIFGVLLGKLLGDPVRFGGFDSTLNTIRVKFRNPNYAPIYVSHQPATGQPAPPPDQYAIEIPRPQR